MADTKISALSANAGLVGTDLFAVVDDPAGTPATQKAAISQIRDYLLALANTWTATQTITPAANTNALAVTGYSLTGSNAQSLIDLAGTWNTTGTPTAIKLNVTNTASNASSLLMDLQVGGASQFSVGRTASMNLGSVFRVAQSGALTAVQSVTGGSGFYFHVVGGGSADGFMALNASNCRIGSTSAFCFSADTDVATAADIFIRRDAANTLAQRNSTNAQTFRVYETYTDASNYERASLSCASDTVTLAAETAGTGAGNMDVAFTPAGTGLVKFGTHSAIGAETVTGYITIKDAGGTSRKIAVVS